MTLFGKAIRAVAIVLALGAGSMHAKPAKADGGAVVAGIAGGLILGTIIGSTAKANNGYYAPAPTYYAPPVPRYYAPAPVYRPYYGPRINLSIGSYYGPKRYKGYRGYRGYKGYRGHRGHRGYRKNFRRYH